MPPGEKWRISGVGTPKTTLLRIWAAGRRKWAEGLPIIALTAQLVALGVIIELVDQIRWNAINRK